jgi:hypothetical protein
MGNLEEIEIEKFSNIIFERVAKSNLEYIDAVVSFCEEKELEIESIINLISPSLKMKMEEEAITLRLLKNSSIRLTF